MLIVLAFRLATAISSRLSLLKSLDASATGLLPTANEVSGKLAEVGTPRNEVLFVVELLFAVAVPRLPDKRDSVTGKRSPTKKVAGLPSCARSKTCRPLCTRLSASEKLAAAPGRVSKNEV